jgi:acetate kinase
MKTTAKDDGGAMAGKVSKKDAVLTINAGSSSIKIALFRPGRPMVREISGKIERIGLPDTAMRVTEVLSGKKDTWPISARSYEACVEFLLDWLDGRVGFPRIRAVGHRVVHGGQRYREPQWISPEMVGVLREMSPFDPEHLPLAIELIEALSRRHPKLPQLACFDTAFHRHMPRVAKLLPIPRHYEAKGMLRYGFHGVSYEYLRGELERIAGKDASRGRVILAHLGNGASLAALRDGKSVDTTMGFTPTSGIPMSTRSGDLDPGLAAFLFRNEGMSPEQFYAMVNSRSGLLGVSEISPDLRDLLEREKSDPRAADAVALFCYQAKKAVGAFAAVLGGVDTLVFSGGIGENSAEVRRRICEGLEFLGIEIDPGRNAAGEPVITRDGCRATVRVIRTDEELQIANTVTRLLGRKSAPEEKSRR